MSTPKSATERPLRVELALERLGDALPPDALPFEDWATASERARYERIGSSRRRRQFVAGHWQLRRTVAAWREGDPRRVRVEVEASGAPSLAAETGGQGFRLSLSHSGDLVACAVADGPVGVDVELARGRPNLQALVEAVCTAGERRRWQASEPGSRLAHFYAMWTLKEAWVKRGRGSAMPMARLHTRPVDGAAEGRVWLGSGWVLALVAPAAAQVRVGGSQLVGTDPRPTSWRIGTRLRA